jgi:uncharacterized membrane protein YhaH (DUF805 family)
MVIVNWFMTALKKYIVFSGRSRRAEFWYFYLGYMIIAIVASLIDLIFRTSLFTIIVSLALVLPTLGVSIRRMHDLGKSGWWILINLIPLVGSIWYIVLAATEGQPAANQYGPDPKQTL